ncbi:MAG: endonuclease III [Candidatus Cloacimonetes bacterium HGW-Cloacimonetes-3]|nr:MAG: endonuclease III [Candidatus Cloacimonetes bacterium HGW-Cloacimonetes-3]
MHTTDIDIVMKRLEKHFNSVKTPIVDLIQAKTKDPFKVLVATILSARTKDETTARVVNVLFQTVHNANDFDKLSISELDSIIYQVGFHNAKTKHLKALPAVLNEHFNGIIPSEIDDLLLLPGVGRKTANLVRAVAFSLPAICVDVHVHRICNRWGYIKTQNPFESEMALRAKLPKKHWLNINSYVVAFGQNLCTPRKPRCADCPIHEFCLRIGV